MPAILAGEIPLGRGAQPVVPRMWRPPAEAPADGAVVHRERRGELARQERRRERHEPRRAAERRAELATETWRGNGLAVGNEVGALRTEATHDGVGEVA